MPADFKPLSRQGPDVSRYGSRQHARPLFGSRTRVLGSLQVRSAAAALVVSTALGCDWSQDLSSDPSYWSPPAIEARGDGSSDPDPTDPLCNGEPPVDPNLRQSMATGFSHRAGEPCLEGCHDANGNARAKLAVGGTIYQSQTSRSVGKAGGTVHGVGSTTLTLDRCGNFYAVVDALNAAVNLTQPLVQNPTLRKMEKNLVRERNPGSCNRAGCHDFSGKLNCGIYY